MKKKNVVKKTRASRRTTATRHVLLTGGTGFVGKVVLEELTRRREELGIASIYVLVRPRKDRGAQHRFDRSIADSDCFSKRTDDWKRICVPVACELTQDDCGLSAADLEAITANVTHVIHCAASVDFDLPIKEAASANVKSALEVLALAQRCKNLVSMVSVSTAYVTVHQSDDTAIHEELQPLPRPAKAIYEGILDGTVDEKELLRETGHPNTYCVTKCIAEHLLMERRGKVPLTIVRPSVVSACLEQPFPGWIDSLAGFAGFAAMCGTGHMRTMAAVESAHPDFVPCDVVSHKIVGCAFAVRPPKAAIRYAVAGLKNTQSVGDHWRTVVGWFRRHPVDREPGFEYVGPPDLRFTLESIRRHEIPILLMRAWYSLSGQKTAERATAALAERLRFLNRAFSYFSSQTFDFRETRLPGEKELSFDPKKYCELVCLGVYRHLLKRDETSVPLGGRAHRESTTDLLWSIAQPEGSATIRALAIAMKKVFRQSTSEITFDRASFRDAVGSLPEGTRLVLLPTHRSYADFLLVSYLCFARPELGISLPAIAAAEEFSRIPLLGKVFQKGGAFYIKRGQGKPDPKVTETVNALVAEGKTLEFFIEGQRSRSRQFLTPRHGLLRCLQGTGEKFALLPVSITYDRIPEEPSLLRELRGDRKAPMRLTPLFDGIRRLTRGEYSFGRIHLKCGEPVLLSPASDVRQVSRLVMGELQENTATTTHHLRCFLAKNPIPGVTLDWLRRELESRGGEVLDSPLRGEEKVDPASEQCMRYQWIHLFYGDAAALWGDHPAIADHLKRNAFASRRAVSKERLDDPRLRGVLSALFAPVARDYAAVAARLGTPEWAPRHASPRSFLYEVPSAHLPNVQSAFADLVERGILAQDELDGGHTWGANAAELPAYREACLWPEDRQDDAKAAAPVVLRAPVAAESAAEHEAAAERREVGT